MKSAENDFLNGKCGVLFALSLVHNSTEYRNNSSTESWMLNCASGFLDKLNFLSGIPLGMAHGTSGWLFSLSRAYRIGILKDIEPKVTDTIIEIINHQDGYLHSRKGWPDLRNRRSPTAAPYLENWCSGAAGIGLARISALQCFNSLVPNEIRKRIEVSIENAVYRINESSFGSLDLCCGEAGKIDFLLLASDVGYRGAALAARKRSVALATKLFETGIESDFLHQNNIGLFKGYSGMGYALCRAISDGKSPAWIDS